MQSYLAPFAPSEGYIVPCGDPTQLAPVRDLPLYAYRGHTTPLAHFHRFHTIVDFDQAGSDGTRFHTLFGQTVKQSGDRGRRVPPLKRTVASTPPSTSSPQTTSVNASTTNESPPLRFLTHMRVAVTTATTVNTPTMTMPPNAPKRCKYGPHSRLRDEMETKENVVGSTLDDEERMTFVPSPHSLLLTVQCSLQLSTFLHPNRTCVLLSRPREPPCRPKSTCGSSLPRRCPRA